MPDDGKLKQRIHAGERIIGVSAPVNASKGRLEEILGKDTYGFVSTDSQHSAFNEERLVEFCRNAEDLGIPVMFRIKHTRHSYLIGNLLDLGPSGVEVPQVEEESTVDEAVGYFYYPQVGKRSWGGGARRGISGRGERLEYAAWWNDYGVLWMQVESLRALTNLNKIAKSGVDCISWGPADLSFDREAHPDHPLKTDDDCVKYALDALKNVDVKLCIRSYAPALRDKYFGMGATVLLESPKP
jgi:2-keto-3-deoxy-L-rhamnonate aldolase RhmA